MKSARKLPEYTLTICLSKLTTAAHAGYPASTRAGPSAGWMPELRPRRWRGIQPFWAEVPRLAQLSPLQK